MHKWRFAGGLGEENKIYGVYWDKGESPTLTRTNNAVGLAAAVGIDDQFVQNDFDSAQIYREIGEVKDALGNVFIRIPKFYIKKTDGIGYKTWQVSKVQYTGYYLPWCFWDFANNRELPYIDVGKYKASLSADKLESKPDVFPLRKRNIVQFRDYAQANGPGYQQLDIHVVDVLRTLFFVEFATLNSQAIMQGYTAGQYSAAHTATVAESNAKRIIVANATADLYAVGQPISIGTSLGGDQIATDRIITGIDVYDASNKAIVFDGSAVNIAVGDIVYNSVWQNGFSSAIAASSGSIVANDGKYPCVYRGIESPFGDIWQFVDGVNINERQAWVCKDATQYTSNVFASPYEQLGYINHDANGYIQSMGFDAERPFAELPTAITDSTTPTQYYCDYYYHATGQKIARFGGFWNYGADAGLSYWDLTGSSPTAALTIGGRLLKKPL
jgi:hypothetical protein